MSGRPRVLYISAHCPSKSAPFAGHRTAQKFLTEYANGADVDLIVIANADEKKYLAPPSSVRLLKYVSLNWLSKLKNVLCSCQVFPLRAFSRYQKTILRLIKNTYQQYDVIHFEFTHGAVYLYLLKELLKGKKTIVSSHDILLQSAMRKRTHNPIRWCANAFETYSTYFFEKAIYDAATEIWVHNPKDAQILESIFLIPTEKIKIKTPAVSEFVEKVAQKRLGKEKSGSKTLLFWGAMNRVENDEAAFEFIQQHDKTLVERGYKLLVVGASPSKRLLARQSAAVQIIGFVDDPSDYFLQADVGIAPLLSGAGIKVKTLEMLRSGLPVVATPIGAEGITDPRLYVADLSQFMQTIDQLLQQNL